MRLLFITSNRLGDAILSTGVLAYLIEAFPGARVTVACGPVAAPLFRAVPRLDRVVTLAKRRRGGHWRDAWRALIGTKFDVMIDLRGSLLTYFLRGRRRWVKFRSSDRLHVVEELTRFMGADHPLAPTIWLDDAARTAAADLIPPGPPVLALAPTANWRGKEWPADRFAAVARDATAPDGLCPGFRIAVFATEGERPQAEATLAGLADRKTIDLIGRTDPLTAAACLDRAALFLGNDSGLAHLAAATGTPTLALFGPGRPGRYRPWGEHSAYVATPETVEELIARPGYDRHTTGTLMDTLTVESVAMALAALAARQSPLKAAS